MGPRTPQLEEGDRRPGSSTASPAPDRPARWGRAALGLVAIGWAAVIVFWEPAPLALPFDDSWYYQTIARHLAAGDGFTHDGLQPTNGFHPLWQLTLVPIVGAADLAGLGPDGSMRSTLMLQLLAVVAALVWLGRTWPRVPLVAAIVSVQPYAFKACVNGMESSLQLVLLCALLAGGRRWREDGRAVRVGLVLGLLALARIEALAFVAAYLGLVGVRDWPFALRSALVAATPIAAWCVAAAALFGQLLPVSGLHLSTLPRSALRMLLSAGALFGGVALAHRLRERPAHGALAFYVCAQLAYTFGFQGPLVPRLWYLAPAVLLAILGSARVGSATERRESPARSRVAWTALVVAVWSLGAGLAWSHRIAPESYASYAGARRDGRWLATHLGPGEWAAGWDVGLVAAHSGGRVANLEGLVAAPGFDPRRAEAFLRRDPRIRYLAQFIRQRHLCAGAPLVYSGVALERLPVARSESVRFSAAVPWMSTTIHRLVFDLRGPPASDVAALRATVCD